MFASEDKKVDSFLKNLSFDTIKECKDAQLLAEALIKKLQQTVAIDIQTVRSARYMAPEKKESHKKFTAVIVALTNISQKKPISSDQAKVLNEYKAEFSGADGGPSRTSAMFDQILTLALIMKGPTP